MHRLLLTYTNDRNHWVGKGRGSVRGGGQSVGCTIKQAWGETAQRHNIIALIDAEYQGHTDMRDLRAWYGREGGSYGPWKMC